jgi:anhydro-N-acetylmuramic acid kinase
LVDFAPAQPCVIGTHYTPYEPSLRQEILALCEQSDNEIQRLGELDATLGKAFAQAANQLLAKQTIAASEVKAIGSHGQTIRHSPQRFTLQIGDPSTIAAETGITTVADFRRKDMACGGHGAPLVPAFHQQVLASNSMNRIIVNIGGIANVTLLPQASSAPVTGFDTGPGNVLLDAWIHAHQQVAHDRHGAWSAQGKVVTMLLEKMLADKYFHLSPPKSTGREYFNLDWVRRFLVSMHREIAPVDVQTTLVELTARSIVAALPSWSGGEILVCGGGAHNNFLMQRLTELAQPRFTVASTQQHGMDPDWMEAVAFAWLARQTLNRQPGNLPSVTGAERATVLGGVYYCG